MDSSSFSAKTFSSLVFNLTNATSLTLHSVESDTITGVQGRRIFAEGNPRPFFDFQLLHVTRVRSSIEVEDEMTASAIIRFSLPHQAFLRGLGSAGIDGNVEIGEAETQWQQWFTATYLDLPPFVAQYLIVGWALTVLGFVSCVACYCCCCKKREVQIPQAAVVSLAGLPLNIPLDLDKSTPYAETQPKNADLSIQEGNANGLPSSEKEKASASVNGDSSSDGMSRVVQKSKPEVPRDAKSTVPPMLLRKPSSGSRIQQSDIDNMLRLLKQNPMKPAKRSYSSKPL